MNRTPVDFALAYAEMGWAVLPIQSRDKVPLTEHGLNDASCDRDTVRAWWSQWPSANIGVACAQSKIVAIDIDPRNGGEQTFLELEDRLGCLPATVEASTGGGGTHLLFESTGVDQPRAQLGPGVDIKY